MQNNNSEHDNHKAPRKLGKIFAAATATLATVTAVAAFNDATTVAVVSGIATGISLPITVFRLLGEGMSA